MDKHIEVADYAYGVAISSSGAIFGLAVPGNLYRGHLSSNTMTGSPISPGGLTIGVTVNSAGDRVYVAGGGEDGLIEIDAATGERLRHWTAAGEQMYDVVLSPDGQTLYAAGSTGTIHSVSVSTFQSGTQYLTTGSSVIHLVHHPSQPLIYASGAGAAREVNTETSAVRTFAVNPSAQASSIALSGDRLFVAGESGTLDAISLATGEVTSTVVPECALYDVVATPDGAALLVTCTAWGTAKLLDPETLSAIVTIPTGGDPRRAAISLDGTRAVIANQSGWFDIIR